MNTYNLAKKSIKKKKNRETLESSFRFVSFLCSVSYFIEMIIVLLIPERLRRLGLPTLEYRRERADVVEVDKILNNTDFVNKENKLFQMTTYRSTRGHPSSCLRDVRD